jgi:hypothetical protein
MLFVISGDDAIEVLRDELIVFGQFIVCLHRADVSRSACGSTSS